MIEGISSVENAQLCFDTFIEANQIANMHAYDQSLEQSIIDSKEDVAVEVLDELKRRNNAFICKTKEDLDKFYQKTFAFDLRTPTLLRLKTKPFTTIDDLKTRVRELVVEGIDYE